VQPKKKILEFVKKNSGISKKKITERRSGIKNY
jgi:hypothetical protein